MFWPALDFSLFDAFHVALGMSFRLQHDASTLAWIVTSLVELCSLLAFEPGL